MVASDAQHYRTAITGIRPAVDHLSAAVDPAGNWVEVTNATDRTLVVLGYAHEPYLMIDAGGVHENTSSLSAQLDQGVVADVTPDAPAAPAWITVSRGRTARWHDLRVQWNLGQRPEEVSAHPDRDALIARWVIDMQLGTDPVQLTGTLRWLALSPTSVFGEAFVALDVVLVALAAGGAVWWWVHRRRARRADG